MITQTPGVYIQEKSILPASIAGVSTAVPLFIGFTEKGQALPVRITSMFEFENKFGGAYAPNFTVDLTTNNAVNTAIPDKRFFLHETLSLYFTNGGGPCHVASAEKFSEITGLSDIDTKLTATLSLIDTLDEVTLVLMPDLHAQIGGNSLDGNGLYSTLVSALINTCGDIEDKKFVILDYHRSTSTKEDMRGWLTPDTTNLKYGSVYYPWLKNAATSSLNFHQLTLNTNSGSTTEISLTGLKIDIDNLISSFNGLETVLSLQSEYNTLKNELENTNTNGVFSNTIKFVYNLIVNLDTLESSLTNQVLIGFIKSLKSNTNLIKAIKDLYRFKKLSGFTVSSGWPNLTDPNNDWFNETGDNYINYGDVENDTSISLNSYTAGIKTRIDVLNDLSSGNWVNLNLIFSSVAGLFDAAKYQKKQLEQQLFTTDPIYINIKNKIEQNMKQTLSQGAIAGIYCKNDRERGVWKSPANIAVQGIEKPLVEVSNSIQDELNHHIETGKSINVIRTFTGRGPLVWGARTLASNDPEWRYISVRRFFNFAEESIKKAMNNFVFEPNNSRTWVKINAMITSFLVQQWKAGALIGTTTDQAFFVRIGEDTTSTTEILEGKINVQIGIAVARPAEFIILTISHKLTTN